MKLKTSILSIILVIGLLMSQVVPAFASGHLNGLAVLGEILVVIYFFSLVTYLLNLICLFSNFKTAWKICVGLNILNIILAPIEMMMGLEIVFYLPHLVVMVIFIVVLLSRHYISAAQYGEDEAQEKRTKFGYAFLAVQALVAAACYFWITHNAPA